MIKIVLTATLLTIFLLQSIKLLAQEPKMSKILVDSLKLSKQKKTRLVYPLIKAKNSLNRAIRTEISYEGFDKFNPLHSLKLEKDSLKSAFSNSVSQRKKNVKASKDSIYLKLKKTSNLDSSITKRAQDLKKILFNEANQQINYSSISKILQKDSLRKTKKIQISEISIGNETQYIATKNFDYDKIFLNNVSLSMQLKIYNIPFDLSLAKTYNAISNFRLDQGNLFKFNLPKPNFDLLFKSDLNKYSNFRKKILNGQTVESFIHQIIQDKITKNIGFSFPPKLQAYLNNPQNIKSIFEMNELELKSKLNEITTEIKNQAQNEGKQLSQYVQDSITNILDSKKQELFVEIQKIKQCIYDSGLNPERIELLEKVAQGKISQQELENFFLSELSKGKDMSFLKKYYVQFREFQAGNFGHQLPGSFLNRDLLLNGFNFSLRTTRGAISIGVSTNRDLNSSKDASFNSSTYSIPKLYSYLSLPTTKFSFGSGKLSWVGTYDRQFNGNFGFAQNVLPRNNMVFTLSQSFNFNKAGTLTFDVSKSSTQYKELAAFGPDQLMIDRNTNGNYFRDDFLQTMAVGLNHSIDSKKLGLRSSVFVNYAGSGFQNPGQQGIGNLNLRFGGNIRKDFFHNKMTITVRSDFKNMPINATDNSHWSNHNIQLDSRFRISRYAILGLKYIDNGVDKVLSKGSTPVYSSKKLQFDLNSNYKFFGQRGFSHVSVAQQEIANPLSLGNSSLMQFNYMQTVVFKNFSLTGNLFYNRELNANTILGNLLNSDATLQYQLFRGISMSSGLSYLDNQHLARQAGIKQSIQFMLKKNFDISAYLDIRKNLITPTYPDLFSTNRGEISLHYYLDKP